MGKRKFFDDSFVENSSEDIYDFEKGIKSGEEEKPHSDYSDHIYVRESDSKEQMFDRNNPVVKAILLVLGLIAAIGTIYYVVTGIGMM